MVKILFSEFDNKKYCNIKEKFIVFNKILYIENLNNFYIFYSH